MRTILYILQKEFIQVFRDKTMLPIIFVVPIVQLLILSYTATFEIKNIDLVVVDHDKSVVSAKIISKFSGSAFFNFKGVVDSYEEGENSLRNDYADQVVVIEPGFERNLQVEKQARIQVVTNAINGSAASLMSAYSISIIADFNREIIVDAFPLANIELPIRTQPNFWYNPELNYMTFMVPGILVLLVTIIGMFLSGMNLVKEKEIGTIEQINVTPIKKYQFIAGKLLPFWVIANIDLAIGLLMAYLVFRIPVVGSLPLLFGVASVYLVAILSIGLFISTMTNTIQQSMFISWFFLVVFILMSGLFTPIESMPDWAQDLNYINPVAYFIKINRMIMLKGSGFADFARDFYLLLIYAVSVLSFAIFRYKKRI
ncbi:MAG: ABC transporter permease [Chlorobi bacterium]|nr:ABC transporter permease [Chlorobiota bacterium]